MELLKLQKKVFIFLKSVNKRYLYSIIFFQLLLGLFPSISVLLLQNIINTLLIEDVIIERIFFLLLIYISIDFIKISIKKYEEYITFIFRNRVVLNLNLIILNKIKYLELKHFEDSETFNMIRRARNNSNDKVLYYFLHNISVISYIITAITNILILLNWRSWFIAILIIIIILRTIGNIVFSQKEYNIIRDRTNDERRKWYYEYLLTQDIAFKELKVYNLFDFFINKYKKLYNRFYNQDKTIVKKRINFNYYITIIDSFFLGVVFFVSIIDAFLGYILIGDTIAYMRSMGNVKDSIENFSSEIVNISQDTLYIREIFELLEFETDHTDLKKEQIHVKKIDSIELKNVSYTYDNNIYVLKNINLTLKKGEIISLVGRNGSGKSTLIKLIAGLYDNYSGKILVNGVDLKNISKDSYYEKVSILFQDYNKYEMSLKENVCIGNLDFMEDDEMIIESLKKSDVKIDNIIELNKQLGYWFENGTQLSGGQWMRVAIARTNFRNGDIYILDEPNASLDNLAENKILKLNKQFMTDKLGVIVTHRLKNSRHYTDKIIVMNNGSIEAQGSHEELLQDSIIYSELYETEEG